MALKKARSLIDHGEEHGDQTLEDAAHDDDGLPAQLRPGSACGPPPKALQAAPLQDASISDDPPEGRHRRGRHALPPALLRFKKCR